MTVVPSGSEWDAMVREGASCDAIVAVMGWTRRSGYDYTPEEIVASVLLAALRAVTTEPCEWPRCACGNDGTPFCPRPARSFAAPRVLVDLEVLREVRSLNDDGAGGQFTDENGVTRSVSRPQTSRVVGFAVRPVEAE